MTKKILTSLDLRGDILIGGTANTTSGYVLTSNGAGTISWSAASSGSLGYVGSFQTTASAGSTISLTVPSVSSGSGNTINLQAGTNTGSLSGANGGAVTITGGSQTNASATRTGGSVTIAGGTSGANGVGGTVYLNGGVGGANGNGTVDIGTTGTDSISLLAPIWIRNPIWLGTAANSGTTGQVLTSAGSGSTPTWTDKGYTLISPSPVAFSGSAPSFSSIPQTYKKLVATISFTSVTGMSPSFWFTVNSGAACSFTTYTTGSGTASVSLSSTTVTLGAALPVSSSSFTIEILNYASVRPMMLMYGGGGSSTAIRSQYGYAATDAAITQLSFSASSWGSATGTAVLYGVN